MDFEPSLAHFHVHVGDALLLTSGIQPEHTHNASLTCEFVEASCFLLKLAHMLLCFIFGDLCCRAQFVQKATLERPISESDGILLPLQFNAHQSSERLPDEAAKQLFFIVRFGVLHLLDISLTLQSLIFFGLHLRQLSLPLLFFLLLYLLEFALFLGLLLFELLLLYATLLFLLQLLQFLSFLGASLRTLLHVEHVLRSSFSKHLLMPLNDFLRSLPLFWLCLLVELCIFLSLLPLFTG